MPSRPPGITGSSPAPPLRVWTIVVLILTAFCIGSIPVFIRYRAGLETEFRRACTARIDAFTTRSSVRDGAPRIVAIGSSLLTCATRFDEEMESLSRRTGNGGVRFLRLSRIQSSVDHFLPVMEEIIAARPDILLIDADIVCYRWNAPGIRSSLADYTAFCRRGIKQLFIRVGGEPGRPSRDRNKTELLGAELGYHVERRDGRFSVYGDSLAHREPRGRLAVEDPLHAVLTAARDRGIRVILLDLPRSRQADDVVPALHRHRSRELVQQLEKECGVRVLAYPHRFPLEMYRDYSHLTEAGAEQYSRWLLDRVRETGAGEGGQ